MELPLDIFGAAAGEVVVDCEFGVELPSGGLLDCLVSSVVAVIGVACVSE